MVSWNKSQMVFRIHSKLFYQLDINRSASQKDRRTHFRWRDSRKDPLFHLDSSPIVVKTFLMLLHWICQIQHGNIIINSFPCLVACRALLAKSFLLVEYASEQRWFWQQGFHRLIISYFNCFGLYHYVSCHFLFYQDLHPCESLQNLWYSHGSFVSSQ